MKTLMVFKKYSKNNLSVTQKLHFKGASGGSRNPGLTNLSDEEAEKKVFNAVVMGDHEQFFNRLEENKGEYNNCRKALGNSFAAQMKCAVKYISE